MYFAGEIDIYIVLVVDFIKGINFRFKISLFRFIKYNNIYLSR